MEREIRPEELSENVFDLIGNRWLLVAANDGEKTNAMTASWGSLGVMWGKPSAFLVIRPQRYTKEFLDRAQTFSLSILPGEKRELLNYMGTVSGRDEDKMAKSGLTERLVEGAPVFAESRLTLVCRKQFCQRMDPACILDREADAVENAVKQVLKEGFRTADIMPEGGKASGENKCSCSEMGSRIAERI